MNILTATSTASTSKATQQAEAAWFTNSPIVQEFVRAGAKVELRRKTYDEKAGNYDEKVTADDILILFPAGGYTRRVVHLQITKVDVDGLDMSPNYSLEIFGPNRSIRHRERVHISSKPNQEEVLQAIEQHKKATGIFK